MQADPGAAARAGGCAGRGPGRLGWRDQCWTLARIGELVHKRFQVEYTLAGLDILLHRIEWSVQVLARRAAERDEAAIAAWREETWLVIKTAADLGAWLCSEDESGQELRPPKGRTRGRRGRTPVVTVTAQGSKRVSVAALIATRPSVSGRARLICRTRLDRGHGKTGAKALPRPITPACWTALIRSSAGRSSRSGTTFPLTSAGGPSKQR